MRTFSLKFLQEEKTLKTLKKKLINIETKRKNKTVNIKVSLALNPDNWEPISKSKNLEFEILTFDEALERDGEK